MISLKLKQIYFLVFCWHKAKTTSLINEKNEPEATTLRSSSTHFAYKIDCINVQMQLKKQQD